MHNDSKQYSFLKPTTPEGRDWPIKMQQMPGPKQNFGRKTGEAKVSQAKQENSKFGLKRVFGCTKQFCD